MKYLLGIDIGTTGIRGIIINSKAIPITKKSINYGFNISKNGFIEESGNFYFEKFKEIVKDIINISKINPENLAGIGISGLAPDVLPIDETGEPLSPCILWLDRRAVKEADFIRDKIGEKRVFQLTGNGIDSSYGLVKILWLKENKPETYKRAFKIVNVKDFVVGKLTGKFVTDYSSAAAIGIAYDIREKIWNKEILKELDIKINKLPKSYPCDMVVGKITKNIAKNLDIVEGIPVIAGTTDALASYTACGMFEDGENAMTLGTSGCWGVIHSKDTFTKNMIILPSATDPDMYVTLVGLTTSGAIYKWLRENFADIEKIIESYNLLDAFDLMNLEAENINAGSDGLITLPYFMGERTPIWDPYARGVLFGLSLVHTKAHLYRSAIEGMAFAFLHNIELIKKAGINIKNKLMITGGGAKSKLIRKILADVLNLDVAYTGGEITAEFGTAFLAGKGVGMFEDYDLLLKSIKVIDLSKPDKNLHQYYYKIYDNIYKEIYPRLKDLFTKLKEIS